MPVETRAHLAREYEVGLLVVTDKQGAQADAATLGIGEAADHELLSGLALHFQPYARILMLGNPLPIVDNPLRLAEELAMIDCISRGRLISGFVRGGGVEQLANNVNPADNRERFEEAHDFIIAAWTRPGPFRWEGKHFQYQWSTRGPCRCRSRIRRSWCRAPPVPRRSSGLPGIGIPYVVLGSSLEQTKELVALYSDTASESGYEMTPRHIGYLSRVFVADTEAKAQADGRNFFWQNRRARQATP